MVLVLGKRSRLDGNQLIVDYEYLLLKNTTVLLLETSLRKLFFNKDTAKRYLQSIANVIMRERNERLLLQPATQQTFLRRQIECLSESAGLSLANALEVPDISSMLCFAMARIGVAVLPKSVAEISSSLVAVPLADIASNCPLILVTASESLVVVALETLIDKKCLDFSLPGKQ